MLERDTHESLLSELLSDDLQVTRKTEILQTLRADYSGVLDTHTKQSSELEKLRADKEDLVVSNSRLFRQLGMVDDSEERKKEEQEKTFSETITLESLNA